MVERINDRVWATRFVFLKSFMDDSSGKDRREVALRNIRDDIREAVVALNMLSERLLKIRALSSEIDSDDQQRVWVAEDRERVLLLECEVVIKSIYNYIFSILELTEIEGIVSLIPKDLLAELKRMCRFRNQLVVHKQRNKVYMRSGWTHDSANLEVSLAMSASGGFSELRRWVDALFEKSRPYLNEEETSEEDFHGRRDVLYKRMARFPGELQRDVEVVIAQYGTKSDPPVILAHAIERLVETFLNPSAR